jgi:hypothetical protein
MIHDICIPFSFDLSSLFKFALFVVILVEETRTDEELCILYFVTLFYYQLPTTEVSLVIAIKVEEKSKEQ